MYFNLKNGIKAQICINEYWNHLFICMVVFCNFLFFNNVRLVLSSGVTGLTPAETALLTTSGTFKASSVLEPVSFIP